MCWFENLVKSYANKFDLSRIAVQEKPVGYEYVGKGRETFKANSTRSPQNLGAGEHGGGSPPNLKAPASCFLFIRPFFLRYVWFSALFAPPLPSEAARNVPHVSQPRARLCWLQRALTCLVANYWCGLISHNLIKQRYDTPGSKHRFCAVRNVYNRKPVLLLGLHAW